MIAIFLAAAVVVLAVIYVASTSMDQSKKNISVEQFKYRRKDFLMTRSEHEFFDTLISILADKYYLFPQIHLSSLLYHKINGYKSNAAFRHINGKSVDYVICDKAYIKPLLAIELDDPTHSREDRQTRDSEVERLLANVRLPIVRFSDTRNISKEEISAKLFNNLPR